MYAGIVGAFILTLLLVFSPAGSSTAHAKVRLNKKNVTMVVGRKAKLKVKGAGKARVTWKSSNKKVATVSKKGVVKAKKPGKAKITAVIRNNGKKIKKKAKIKVISKTTYYMNNKKKIYNYVVKHGKYDKYTEAYELKKVLSKSDDPDGPIVTAYIQAFKGTKIIRFMSSYYSQTPDDAYHVYMTMKYNQMKPGILYYDGMPMDYVDDELELDGVLDYTFDGGNSAIKWTHQKYINEYDGEVTESDTVESSYKARGNSLIKKGFKGWNAIAKKAGTSMKGIGFTKYK